jgi:hypothetical protein
MFLRLLPDIRPMESIRGLRDPAQQAPHSPALPRRPCRAVSRHLINVCLSKGFVRKQIAPAFIARSRIVPSGKAVMKMNGTRCPWACKRACRSIPLMAGIWTSATTHDASSRWEDPRNSSADVNVRTVCPSDLRRLPVAMRMEASSSTTEISGGLDTITCPLRLS